GARESLEAPCFDTERVAADRQCGENELAIGRGSCRSRSAALIQNGGDGGAGDSKPSGVGDRSVDRTCTLGVEAYPKRGKREDPEKHANSPFGESLARWRRRSCRRRQSLYRDLDRLLQQLHVFAGRLDHQRQPSGGLGRNRELKAGGGLFADRNLNVI